MFGLSNKVYIHQECVYISFLRLLFFCPIFSLFFLAWLDLLWQAQQCITEVCFVKDRAYIFFQGSSYLIWTLAYFAWHGLAWLALAADTAGGWCITEVCLNNQKSSNLLSSVYYNNTSCANLGFSVLGKWSKWWWSCIWIWFQEDFHEK